MTTILERATDINRVISKLPSSAEIYASSFNISTWLTHGPARTLLSEFNHRKTHLVIGVPEYRPAVGRGEACYACAIKHKKSLLKLAALRDEFTNIDWVFVRDVHAKFVVSTPYAITGGRNISDSKIGDVSFVSKDPELCEKLIDIWKKYALTAYDIGTDGPLVFTTPYNGELMADSASIPDEYKHEIAENFQGNEVAQFWRKTL